MNWMSDESPQPSDVSLLISLYLSEGIEFSFYSPYLTDVLVDFGKSFSDTVCDGTQSCVSLGHESTRI